MEYLYHCAGCKKDDTEYPDKEVKCDEPDCNDGLVLVTKRVEDGRWVEDGMDECFKCEGTGKFRQRIPVSYHMWARNDAYGRYTGLYCDKCYKDNYPYKKDRYFDPAYAGERMEADE